MSSGGKTYARAGGGLNLKRSLAGGFLLLVVVAALLAPWLAPYGQAEIVTDAYAPWSSGHWLGGDQLGRDFFSRLLFGLRNALAMAIAITALSLTTGGALGILAAAAGGWVDGLLARLVDILMALPALIFALMLLAIFGTGVAQMILIIAALDATRVFRLARTLGMREAARDYVEAARLRGERLWWIMGREILPNMMWPLLAEGGMRFAFVFLTISTLSFLGLGLQPPAADLGSMVRETAALIGYGDFTPLIPAALIAAVALAVNLLLDGLAEAERG